MIQLPHDWTKCSFGNLAEKLYWRIDRFDLRASYATFLIESGLKVFAETFPRGQYWKNNGGDEGRLAVGNMKLSRWRPFGWRLGRLRYIYLPELTDRALDKCVDVLDGDEGVIFIAPPDQEDVLRQLLEFRWKSAPPPSVNSFSFFSLGGYSRRRWMRN